MATQGSKQNLESATLSSDNLSLHHPLASGHMIDMPEKPVSRSKRTKTAQPGRYNSTEGLDNARQNLAPHVWTMCDTLTMSLYLTVAIILLLTFIFVPDTIMSEKIAKNQISLVIPMDPLPRHGARLTQQTMVSFPGGSHLNLLDDFDARRVTVDLRLLVYLIIKQQKA